MTVLLDAAALDARRAIAGGPLAPLADSLRADLEPLLARGEIWIPPEKARLTRVGGRCPADGVLLEFDPWSPRAHRCPKCGRTFVDEEHYRWWIMNYQLWLAERAVHAAALHAVRGDADCAGLARDILTRYAVSYLDYPDRDNVLGPTRLFFSTYLESIWLLQLAVALDLLEQRDGPTSLGGEVRDRIVAPSARLIASFDEGLSNRQVWNNAAMAAAGALLGDGRIAEGALEGASGTITHTREGLLADGTWYEGENYHLFAHRGLSMAVAIAEAQGWEAGDETRRRVADGFAAPFATALPDFTFPSRRDSQYKVSLRQWRIAESCELGLARADDARLRTALAELYRDDVAAGDTGRARSTAEAERNEPAVRLTRASLGWKSLLFARRELPELSGRPPSSAHLEGQGIAVLRRASAKVYVALDYGASGGGHGHPDRLNLWLVVGDARFLEDVGTGSYVEKALHWYRSTLAHNAPLADGRSQWRVDGTLVAWEERGGSGWISAEAEIAPGVLVRRTVVVMPGYLVDEVRWKADRVITLDLPSHLDGEFADRRPWKHRAMAGGRGVEDGFDFVSAAEYAPSAGVNHLVADRDGSTLEGWLTSDAPHEWWRCVAPGPPGGDRERRFLVQRARARDGIARSVWSWSGDVRDVAFQDGRIVVGLGADERHEHVPMDDQWHVDLFAAGARSSVDLHGGANGRESNGAVENAVEDDAVSTSSETSRQNPGVDVADTDIYPVACLSAPPPVGAMTMQSVDAESARRLRQTPGQALRFRMGESSYRRSESTWKQAGAPEALVALAATSEALVVEISVRKPVPVFRLVGEENALDNEHPDVNSDGVQLYLGAAHGGGRYYAWLLVPVPDSAAVRVTATAAFGPPASPNAGWRLTRTGYVVRCEIPRWAIGERDARDFMLDVIVNTFSPGRERREGQLVLSGARGEWVYLRGDRQDSSRALPFRIFE